MRFLYLALLLIGAGCSSQMFNDHQNDHARVVLQEIRQELADVQHALKSTQVSLQILEEKFETQETHMASLKNTKGDQLGMHLALLEKKCIQLEKMQEKVLADLKNLNAGNQQNFQKMVECEREISSQKARLDEVAKLKTTLTSISQAMQQKPKVETGKKHKIKSGETLEKIARQYGVSVTALKKQNRIGDENKIILGEELEIPNE